jgi:hypothetical protein
VQIMGGDVQIINKLKVKNPQDAIATYGLKKT